MVARFGEHAYHLHVYKTIIQDATFLAHGRSETWRRHGLQGLPLMTGIPKEFLRIPKEFLRIPKEFIKIFKGIPKNSKRIFRNPQRFSKNSYEILKESLGILEKNSYEFPKNSYKYLTEFLIKNSKRNS